MLRESLSRIQHEIWVHWMTYLFNVSVDNHDGSFTIPAEKVSRWVRQMDTAYENLSEAEKESDREQADKIINMIREYMSDINI